MPQELPITGGIEGERLTPSKILRFLSLPFRSENLKTYMAVHRFEDIPIDKLVQDGIQGIILDADGTLCEHHAVEFSESVVNHVQEMRAKGLRIAIYTNAIKDRFKNFSGIEVVTEVPPKPDVRGFSTVMKKFLYIDDPAKVCMIGDNYITDGGAISAGINFIYVHPVAGGEHFFHAATRTLAYRCARFYFPDLFSNFP